MTIDADKKKILIGAAVGVAAAGAVGYILYKNSASKSSSAGDDVAWQAPVRQAQTHTEAPKKDQRKAETTEKGKPEAQQTVVSEDDDITALANELVAQIGAEEKDTANMPELGLAFGDLGPWTVHVEEDGQAVVSMNNSAIVRFGHTEFSPMLGDQPLGNLLVEDQTKEHYTTTKECSEAQLARSLDGQLPEGMPPQMAELLKPRIVESKAIHMGPFDYLLVYDQQGPGMSLRSRQFQKLQNGILYTLQVAVPTQIMEKLVESMDQLAGAITFTGRAEKPAGKQVYTSAKAKAKISVPMQWVSGRPPAALAGNEGLISWDTNAENVARRDEIKLYHNATQSGEELAKSLHTALDAKGGLNEVNGVWTFKTTQGAHKSQIYVKDSLILQVVAASQEIVTAPESIILEVVSTVTSADGEEELRAYSPALGVSFKAAMGATLVESHWADATITYNVSREEGAPSLIIAMPQPDPSKPPPDTIEGWFDRVEEEFPQTDTSRIEDKNYETVAGQKAVAFTTREMVPVAGYGMFTGAAEEQKAKMYVLQHNKVAYLIRYATVSGEFRRLENTLKPVIQSFKFTEE